MRIPDVENADLQTRSFTQAKGKITEQPTAFSAATNQAITSLLYGE